MTFSHNKSTRVAEMTKKCSTSQPDVILVVMNALVNVLVDEVLIIHCHENGDCHEPDDGNPERSDV